MNPQDPDVPINPIDKQKYDVYVSLPSVVKDFIYTGLNRTSIHAMLRELVFQRELEKMGKRDWVKIAIAIFLILLGIGFAIRFIVGAPEFAKVVGGVTRMVGTPPRIGG